MKGAVAGSAHLKMESRIRKSRCLLGGMLDSTDLRTLLKTGLSEGRSARYASRTLAGGLSGVTAFRSLMAVSEYSPLGR